MGKCAFRPAVGNDILIQDPFLISPADFHHFLDELPIALFISRILDQMQILIDDRMFAVTVKHWHLMILLIGNHIFYCMHSLFEQFGHLRINFIDLFSCFIQHAHVITLCFIIHYI